MLLQKKKKEEEGRKKKGDEKAETEVFRFIRKRRGKSQNPPSFAPITP